jgi:cobalt-zinc-cadmium resistance protein CzcA
MEGRTLDVAVVEGASHTVRAVLTTAAVAALGFAPMALATGAGSEVQRPLATVVIFGIVLATGLMLLVFPGILKIALGRWNPEAKRFTLLDEPEAAGSVGSSFSRPNT